MKNFGAKWLALAAMSAAVAGMGLNGCGGGDNGTGTAGTGGAGKGGTTGAAGKGGTTGTGRHRRARRARAARPAPRAPQRRDRHAGGGGTAAPAAARRGRRPPVPRRRDVRHHRRELRAEHVRRSGQPRDHRGRHAGDAFLQRDGGPALPGLAEGRCAVHALTASTSTPSATSAATTLKNWAGMKLHVRVKVASGGNSVPGELGRPALRQHGRQLQLLRRLHEPGGRQRLERLRPQPRHVPDARLIRRWSSPTASASTSVTA